MGRNILLSTNSAKGKKFLFPPKTSRPILGLAQLHIQWMKGVSFSVVNRLGREFNHPPPPISNVKNEWNYTSTTPIRLHGVDREILPLCALKWISEYGLQVITGG